MVLTKKLKYDDPVVHMNGEQISLVGEIRLLGLTIDRKLMFISHVAKACKKASNTYKSLARADKDLGDTIVDRELEKSVYFDDLSHPAHMPEIGYESVEDMDSSTLDRLAVVGPHVYTDGSRIEGKVGAALTDWLNEKVIRSALEVLTNPKTYHPLAHEARRDISEIVA
ncbi:hypothetical protein EVAR_68641_1 [Eumeta japonica]|uniref:Uncharacterized protein n=1 Tax=Eumeta variegata TaxID=151549 RepID=A0A4C1ZXE5_EUMVA|nr:hypothetical protein EVAR_68641_1 [Eumeta japonica]